MTWSPISQDAIERLLARELAACDVGDREYFLRVRVPLVKWSLSPWGDEGGGFWVVAVSGHHVLWYNDIEDGFNVSAFRTPGVIPTGQYWCDQAELRSAVKQLARGVAGGAGPPQPFLDS